MNSILPCDPCRKDSNFIWVPTKLIPRGLQILTEIMTPSSQTNAILTPRYLATRTEMNPIAFESQLNEFLLACNDREPQTNELHQAFNTLGN